MNDRHRLPSTSDRSPRRQPALWLLVALALAMILLATPAYGSGMALTTTVEIGDNVSLRVEDVTIRNRSGDSCWFTVTKSTEPPGGIPADLGETPLQWDITSPDCVDLLVDLQFHYTDDELDAGNGVYEGALRAFRYVGGGVWADQCGAPCVYPATKTVRVTDVTLLGDWTIGDISLGYPGPTAVTVRGSAGGADFDESAWVLGLSVLAGIGLILGWRLRSQSG
jgi:hypothetical protein